MAHGFHSPESSCDIDAIRVDVVDANLNTFACVVGQCFMKDLLQ